MNTPYSLATENMCRICGNVMTYRPEGRPCSKFHLYLTIRFFADVDQEGKPMNRPPGYDPYEAFRTYMRGDRL